MRALQRAGGSVEDRRGSMGEWRLGAARCNKSRAEYTGRFNQEPLLACEGGLCRATFRWWMRSIL